MRLLLFKSISIFFVLKVSLVFALSINDNICFYYGDSLPEEMHSYCNYIVVDDGNLQEKPVVSFDFIPKYLAYVSVGESLEPKDKKWILGVNEKWNSYVMDLSNEEYFNYLLEKVGYLLKKGYSGIFLDTLDSARLFLRGDELNKYFEKEILLIQEIKKRFPDKLIILNRGFEVVDKVASLVQGIAVESLFSTYDSVNKSYVEVQEKQRKELVGLLNKIKNRYNLPIVVIDYVKPGDIKRALFLSNKIKELGFLPYITNGDVTALGVNKKAVIPRKVLVLTDARVDKDIYFNSPSRLITLPLEYLGYVPEIRDVSSGFPEFPLKDRYAGIIVWLNRDVLPEFKKFHSWVLRAIAEGNKFLFLESFGFPEEEEFLKPLGLKISPVNILEPNFWLKEGYFNFETPFRFRPAESEIVLMRGEPWVVVKGKEQEFHPIAKTWWGGYALGESFLVNFPEELWTVNPFKLVKEMLELPNLPVPDTTTELGKRILMAHLDGDGAISKAEFIDDKLSLQVIYQDILKKYPIPHGVSFIEAEVAPTGLYPQLSSRALKWIRKIWALDYVEPASHSYSHPYFWRKVAFKEDEQEVKKEFYNLPVKGYKPDLKREIVGSVDFLSKFTSKKIKLFFWTGDCLPSEKALEIAYKKGLYNINGGDTIISNKEPWFSRISPLGFKRGKYIQIFAPQQNENIYTNLWQGPFYGYKQVIQTYLKTEKPFRLKPIDIYYHFYSGSKLASLNALKYVYNFCLKQDVHPLFVSEFIKRGLAFYNSVLLSNGKNLELVKKGKYFSLDFNLTTLRLNKDFEVKNSYGKREYNNFYYVHLIPSLSRVEIVKKDSSVNNPYLISLNANIIYFKKNNRNIDFKFAGYLPINGSWFIPKGCTLEFSDKVTIKKDGQKHVFSSPKKELQGRVKCP